MVDGNASFHSRIVEPDNQEDEIQFSSLDELDNDGGGEVDTNDDKGTETPERFKDKSQDEILDMYINLEKAYGRQANELGDLRKLSDDYLRRELEKYEDKPDAPEGDKDELSFDDLVDDPAKAINERLDKRLQKYDKKFEETERQRRLEKFADVHPDYKEIGESQEFIDWIKSSPLRVRVFQAAQQYDLDAANDLLTEYKDTRKKDRDAAQEEAKSNAKKDLRKVDAESGTRGGSESSNGKVYRKADLIRMRIEDPDRFDSMQTEIMAAYKEGRVR